MNRNEARQLARRLMDRHGLATWDFGFDRAVRRAGRCHFDERRITLSAALVELWPTDEVEQTILHEIAHALAGPAAKHGRKWQDIARKIGVDNPRATYRARAEVPPRWVGYCPAGHAHYRYRRPRTAASCCRCNPTYSERFLITWHPYEPAGDQ